MAASAEVGTGRTGGARIAVQKFGTFLSGMIMPNIAAFIAWGLITALFIETGWTPLGRSVGSGDADGDGLCGACRPDDPVHVAVADRRLGWPDGLRGRGAVVAAVATMGVIMCTTPDVPGCDDRGAVGGVVDEEGRRIWDGKIKPGFEMLVNNFSAGILARVWRWSSSILRPVIESVDALGNGVNWLIEHSLLPLASILLSRRRCCS